MTLLPSQEVLYGAILRQSRHVLAQVVEIVRQGAAQAGVDHLLGDPARKKFKLTPFHRHTKNLFSKCPYHPLMSVSSTHRKSDRPLFSASPGNGLIAMQLGPFSPLLFINKRDIIIEKEPVILTSRSGGCHRPAGFMHFGRRPFSALAAFPGFGRKKQREPIKDIHVYVQWQRRLVQITS